MRSPRVPGGVGGVFTRGGYRAEYGGGAGAYSSGMRGYGEEDCCTGACAAMEEVCSCGKAGCATCAAACGARPDQAVLAYVGQGGDWTQETKYKYAGAGGGEFGLIRIPGVGPNCCLLLVPLGALLLGLPLLLWAMTGATSTTSTTPAMPTLAAPETPPNTTTTTTSLTYDCEKDPPHRWSTGKMSWCCDEYGKGCPTTPPTPPPPHTQAPKVDCSSSAPESWDLGKRVQCCLLESKGCPTTPTTTTTPCPIDCDVGFDDLDPLQWVRGWSGKKKLYCCRTANRGCPSELPPPSGLPPSNVPPALDTQVYDCEAGYHHCMHCLVEAWSPNKLDYCCKNFHKGCKGEEPE